MARTKLTVRRIRRLPPWLLNRRQKRKIKRPFKIKTALSEQKRVNIKKNGNVVKTINVRRKTTYFNDRWARTF